MIRENALTTDEYRWSIGDVEIAGPLVLGPMAGFTSPALRILCRRAGAHLVYSEMVAAQGIKHRNRKTFALLRTFDQEQPVAVQIFGGDPEIMADAVPFVEKAGAAIIDINMGCPVPKVLRSEGGAALMYDAERAVAIAAAMAERATVPVTCKIRAGVILGDSSYLDLALRLQDAGVAAVAIHGRTVKQGYCGDADHAHTKALVQALDIPVIASGDVFSPKLPASIIDDTGCAGVMIARGAVGRPWIFSQAKDVLAGREPSADPAPGTRMGIALCQAQMMALEIDEARAVHKMRAHLAWYTKGLPGGKRLRGAFNTIQSLGDMRGLMHDYVDYLAAKDVEPPPERAK